MLIGAVVSNRITALAGKLPEGLSDLYSFSPPGAYYSPKYRAYLAYKASLPPGEKPEYRDGLWDGRVRLLRRGRLSTGLFFAMLEDAQKHGFEFDIEKSVIPPEFAPWRDAERSDRQYQNDAVDAMVRACGDWGGGLVVAATGSGKTFIAGMLFRRLRGSACFIVDELTLWLQAKEEFERVLGEEVGLIGNGRFEPRRITVATVQTLHKYREDRRFEAWHQTLDMLVVDEVHVQMNRRGFETIETIQPKAVFGITATLALTKAHVKMRAYSFAGPVCYRYAIERGVEEGYLSSGIVIRLPMFQIDATKPKRGKKDWRKANDAMPTGAEWWANYDRLIATSRARNELICDLAREAVRRGRRCIVLVEKIEHIHTLSAMVGVHHEVVYGDIKDRARIKKSLQRGDVRLIIANRVFNKGVDMPNLDTVIDAAAMSSRESSVQKFGRGIRRAKGKDGLIFIDIADQGNSFEAAARERRLAFLRAKIKYLDAPRGTTPKAVFYRAESVLCGKGN